MKKAKVVSIATTTLAIEYVVCRYLLFDLHQTKDIPFGLFVFCVAVACTAAALKKNKLVMCTVAGYILSFFLGLVFNVEWIDPHGTACSNFWIWFVVGVVVFVIIGVLCEVISQLRIAKD